MKKFLSYAFLIVSTVLARADAVVVFNEIMYHPRTNEAALEWVELHNQMAVDVELSGWSIRGGIDYDFAEGTVIPGGGFLVIALSPTNLIALGITNVLGPFSGRLSNSGEELRLRNNNGRVVNEVSYSVEDQWPVAADGAGPSLAKFDADSASAVPSNWRASAQMGGTPGVINFPRITYSVTTQTLLPISQSWRFDQSGADLGTAWRGTSFNDTSWSSGQALLAAEDCACLVETIRTPLTVGATKTNFYFRATFNYTGSVAAATLSLRHVVDDGLVVYLNGAEVWRMGMATGVVNSATFANRGVDNASYEGPFAIPSTSLISGTNVLAVEVHQNAVNSTDVVFGMELFNSITTTNIPTQIGEAPVTLAFNEMSSVSNAQFWVELVNQTTQPIVLDNYILARF
ncbi:MAG TPA: lamin tail domain-containing protein, partial [Candidatus Acidoferrum sp.]|nr:lamin tail domain-containing protein [Candidatus Acidoferrum sp.]